MGIYLTEFNVVCSGDIEGKAHLQQAAHRVEYTEVKKKFAKFLM